MGKWAKYKKKYCKEWERNPILKGFLTGNEGDDYARCKYCRTDIRAHMHDLINHSKTAKHLRNLPPVMNGNGCKPINKIFPTKLENKSIVDSRKRRELRIATFVASHSSILAVDDLGEILRDEFKDTGFQMHRTKCTAVIKNVLSPHFRKILIQDIGDAPFSILIDESTDVSVEKLLAISIKYFSRSKVEFVTTFMGLVAVEDGTAQGLTDELLAFLKKINLNTKNLIGIATDGASTMCGVRNSVFTKMKEKVPDLVLIKCVCHSIDLVAKKAMEAIPGSIEHFLKSVYNWFCHSAKRQLDFKNIFKTINEDEQPSKLISLSKTRWLVIADCMERILNQYEELKLFFNIFVTKEKDYEARVIKEMLDDPKTKLYMEFLLPILMELKRITKLFQMDKGDPCKIFSELHSFFEMTMARIVKPAVFRLNKEADKLLTLDLEKMQSIYLSVSDCDLGPSFLEKLENSKLSVTAIDEMKKRCFNFIKSVCMNCQMRFPNSRELLNLLESISPIKILAGISSLSNLPKKFFKISEIDLENQLRMLNNLVWNEKVDSIKFWKEVYEFQGATGDYFLRGIAEGAIKILCLPISNAHVERVFSQVNIVKNDLRNSLSKEVLESILYVRFGLSRMGIKSSEFVPTSDLLNFNSSIYE